MKKLIALLTTIAILICMYPVYTLAKSEDILILGDANLDTKVNIKDATFVQKYVAKTISFTDAHKTCADCNADENINIKDATWIQKFVANMECPYPIGDEIRSGVPESSTADDTTVSTAITEATEVLPTESTIATVATEPTENSSPTETTEPVTESEPSEVITYNPVKPDTNITIYFSNNVNWATVNAYFYNEEKQIEMKTWPGTAMKYLTTNEMGEKVYSIDVDVSRYNRVVFNNGKSQTLNSAVTVASSGFYITRQTPKNAMQLGIYSYDTADYGTKKSISFDYPAGYKKTVEIWTPAGYDSTDTTKKYSVIYLLDGQNQFDDSDAYEGGWGSDEVITALMKNGGEGIILVGIDNGNQYRDNELTPDIGDVVPSYNYGGFKNGKGDQFAEFVVKTVVPYVESNYNVYTDAAHSAIVGSSSGGIEAFYIGMEYIDEFSRIGAISPAFLLYNKSTWLDYFKKFDFTADNLPRIYFYNGGGDSLELELLPNARDMKTWLKDLGYDDSKMTFVYDEKNAHNEAAWRAYMPEIVTWLFELQ